MLRTCFWCPCSVEIFVNLNLTTHRFCSRRSFFFSDPPLDLVVILISDLIEIRSFFCHEKKYTPNAKNHESASVGTTRTSTGSVSSRNRPARCCVRPTPTSSAVGTARSRQDFSTPTLFTRNLTSDCPFFFRLECSTDGSSL